MDTFDLAQFQLQLAATQYWCQQHLSLLYLTNSLRTPPLSPDPVSSLPFFSGGGIGDAIQPVFDFFAWVTDKKIKAYQMGEADTEAISSEGRLLIFYLSRTLCDGIGPLESGGFIDDCNFPAWDTWVWIGEDQRDAWKNVTGNSEGVLSYLVCWIPPELYKMTQDTIDLIAEQCLSWLDQSEFELSLTKPLQEHGYIK